MNEPETSQGGAAIEAACATLRYLREPGRCAWDRKQTLASLAPYLIEEAHEAVEAGVKSDMPGLRDELGDVLLQVLFQSMIAEEEGHFSLQDVAVSLRDKLIRRHPHLLEPDGRAAPPGRQPLSWEALKALERPQGTDPLAGVPRSLPALLKATRMQEKRELDATLPQNRRVLATRITNLTSALVDLVEARESTGLEAQNVVGDLLFAIVGAGRLLEVDAERALSDACERFAANFVPVS